MGTFTVTTNYTDSVTPVGVRDGVNQTFTLTDVPEPLSSLSLYYNGLLLTQDVDYDLNNNQITMLYVAPTSSDIFTAFYRTIGSSVDTDSAQISGLEVPAGAIDGSNVTFSLSETPIPPESLILAYNGLTQKLGIDFTLDNNVITFINPPQPGGLLVAGYRFYQPILNRSNSISKASILYYIRNYLNDPSVLSPGVTKNSNLWDDSYLNRIIAQGEVDITQKINIYWARFPLTLYNGQALYTMPVNLKSITRMTYKSVPIEMLTQKEMSYLIPTYRTQISRTLYATLQFEGYYVLRLFCAPCEDLPSISTGNDVYTDLNIMNEFQISAYFYATESNPYFICPDWMIRLTIRYYVMWKAFSKEGDGQDVKVGDYFRNKYEAQIAKNIIYFAKIYASEEKQLAPSSCRMGRVPRPVLPSNYGPIVY